jgi:predicted Zn-dependent protease
LPFTVNGIGTHYYGSGNGSARAGTCPFCHRSATLSSYDTREWICFAFIPVIPLRKYRILDSCSSCRKHHRVAFDAFAKQVAAAVEPLREAVRRSPSEPQAYLDLVNGLVEWEMRAEARKEVEAAVARFPRDAAIHVRAAQLAVDRNDWTAALPFFERAQAIDPQNGQAVYGYGWTLHQLGRDAEAVSVLQRSAAQSYHLPGVLFLVGTSCVRLERWNEALQAYQQLLGMMPEYLSDKGFMRLVAECKRRLGFELTDAERKAGRSWWPFGKAVKVRKPRPVSQSGPAMIRPGFIIAGLILVTVVVLSLGYLAWDRYTNVNVYFDNGLSRPVALDVDGTRNSIRAYQNRMESLKRGRHTVVVREARGNKELERMTIDLQPMSFLDSIFHKRFYVYNVASMRVYRRSVHGYAVDVNNSTYDEQILGPERFFEQRDVDYAFQLPPDTIEMDANASRETKIAFNPANDIPLSRYAIQRMREGKKDEASTLMARAVANEPCDVPTRRTQVGMAAMSDSVEAASAAAHQWIVDCAAEDNLEAHRLYQDVNTQRGRQEAMREEYRASLASEPGSGRAHYLFGRLAVDPQVAIAEQSEAIRLDPALIWARVARGHALAEEERYDEALADYAVALDMPRRDPSVVLYYATAAVAKGTPEVAVKKVEQIRDADPKEPGAMAARWLLAAAAQDWNRARRTAKELEAFEGTQDAWFRRLLMLRLAGGEAAVDAEIKSALGDKEMIAIARRAQIEHAFDKGDYRGAASAASEETKGLAPGVVAMEEAYIAGAMLITGDAASAAKVLDSADVILASDDATSDVRVTSALVRGVRGTMPLPDVLSTMRENNAMEHYWFVAGVRAAVARDLPRARESFARAQRAASTLYFPYLEVKRMAALF